MRRTVPVVLRSIALSMSLENVIHHRETQTAHQFAIELQMAVVHAVRNFCDPQFVKYLIENYD